MSSYIGRFAPSPTGPLHFGSLVAALASWVDARSHKGIWLLRVEDIDPPREIPGAKESIISALRAHGLNWDGEIEYQRNRSGGYEKALRQLRENQRLFACTCTRKQLREAATVIGNSAYPGHCRSLHQPEHDFALRFSVKDETIRFNDLAQGPVSENVSHSTGDFIVRRRGKLYAYQLAVVVDDAVQGITHVVRGADLLDNTPRQIALQRALDYPTPSYLHVPLALSGDGRKLSKQTGAPALDSGQSVHNLACAWKFLNQDNLPKPAENNSEFLAQAISHWRRDRLCKSDNLSD